MPKKGRSPTPKERRKRLGLSLLDLTVELRNDGMRVSPQTLNRREEGKSPVDGVTARAWDATLTRLEEARRRKSA